MGAPLGLTTPPRPGPTTPRICSSMLTTGTPPPLFCGLSDCHTVFDLVKLQSRPFKEKTYNSSNFIGLRFQANGNKIASKNKTQTQRIE